MSASSLSMYLPNHIQFRIESFISESCRAMGIFFLLPFDALYETNVFLFVLNLIHVAYFGRLFLQRSFTNALYRAAVKE